MNESVKQFWLENSRLKFLFVDSIAFDKIEEMIDCTEVREKMDNIRLWLRLLGYDFGKKDDALVFAGYLMNSYVYGEFLKDKEHNDLLHKQLKDLIISVKDLCRRVKEKTGVGITLKVEKYDNTKHRFVLNQNDTMFIRDYIHRSGNVVNGKVQNLGME